MKRRTALITIGLTALRGVAWSISRPRLALAKMAQAGTPSNEEIDNRLRDDMTRRKQRVNSEEGIAMFLVCENLVPGSSAPVELTPQNAALAAEFQETAAAWERVYPGAEYGDVAHVIEVMAARDFAHGGTGGAQ